MDARPVPKHKTYRNSEYLDYVRWHPCLFCGKPAPNEAHHVSLGDAGFGLKSSDLGCIPLCHTHHRLYHEDPAKFGQTISTPELFEALYWLLRGWIEKGE